MKIVNLHGKIAEKFGARWELEINSISEALRAIDANVGNFFEYLSEKQEENNDLNTKKLTWSGVFQVHYRK